MSHVLAGLAGAWLIALIVRTAGVSSGPAAGVGVVAAALASGAQEALQLRRGGMLRDGLEDFGFVLAGALWTASGGGLPLWLATAFSLGVGAVVRGREAAAREAAAARETGRVEDSIRCPHPSARRPPPRQWRAIS